MTDLIVDIADITRQPHTALYEELATNPDHRRQQSVIPAQAGIQC